MYRVIIVEDDPMVASINKQYIESNSSFQVQGVFRNGKDALDYVRDHVADLAIVDYYMPVLDGLGFMEECKRLQLPMDIIMITAANNAGDIRRIMRMGVIDYLIKPFTQQRFLQAIDRFLQIRRLFEENQQVEQDAIDTLLQSAAASESDNSEEILRKGLQMATLQRIQDYLEEHNEEYLSSEEVARSISLSRITVRRYMNYLLEQKKIVSQIDYSTGGRPSIKYRMINHQ